METETVAPATPTEIPPPTETPEPSPEPTIAEHEAQFGKGTPKTVVEPGGKDDLPPRPRHRAAKDRAFAEDVPRINELTKKLRDAERERDEWKSKASAPHEPERRPEPERPKEEPAKPSGKPSWATFEAEIGTKYQTWADAQDAYVDARDDWRDAQAKHAAAEQQKFETAKADQERQRTEINAYFAKVQEFSKTKPDFQTVTAPIMDRYLPGVLLAALVRSENAPELVYHLGQHPDDLDELILLSDGKSASDESVALLQRRLTKLYGQAATTGSVPVAPPRIIAPRPPNPVRTGPLKTTDEPPGDDASIAEHEKFYGKRRR